jgi:hypothetical protein
MGTAINKSILAQKYGWSLKVLMTRINSNEELYNRLKKETGYHYMTRILTPKQVELIYLYFGEPGTN